MQEKKLSSEFRDSNKKYAGASLHDSKYFSRQAKKPTSLL